MALANETVKASAFLTVDDDALNVERRWPGRVWLNPPYAMPLIERFVGKLVSEYEHPDGGTTSAILLVNNCTETQWFHLALNRASSVCLPRGRLNYLRDGTKIGGPMQVQSLFYFGPDPLRFEQAFREIGRCVYPNKQELNEEEYAVVKLSTREELEEWILRDYGEEALREFRADR